MQTFTKYFEGKEYECTRMYAWDALEFLPDVLSIFEGEGELVHMVSEHGREQLAKYSNLEQVKDYIASKEKFSDEYFLIRFFHKSQIKVEGEPFNPDIHVETITELFEIFSWAVECSYLEALDRPQLVITKDNPVFRADRILKQHFKPSNSKYAGWGVLPPTIPPWIFKVVCQVDKNKRVDWELIHKLRTEYDLVDFVIIWECLEAEQTFEAAATINSIPNEKGS